MNIIMVNGKRMSLGNVLSNPKVMALSGLLAMVPKGIIVGILSFSLGLFLSKGSFWEFCFVLYPIVGILLDIVLYSLKNKLWKTLPELESIPEDWKILPEELLQFAKQLPKVRLMRFAGCLSILPFMIFGSESSFSEIFSSMITGYFVCALFDGIWLEIFGIKRPEYIVKPSEYRSNFDDMSKHASKQCDPTAVGSPAWYSQFNNNPFAPGSSAWYINKSINSRE